MIGVQQLFGAISFAPLLLFGANATIQSSICYPVDQPAIIAPTAGTSVAQGSVYVVGTSAVGSTVAVKVDGQTVAQVTTTSTGNFGATISVVAGTRTLTAVASNPCSSSTSGSVVISVQSPTPTPTPTPTPAPVPTPTPIYSTQRPSYSTTTSNDSQSNGGTISQDPLTLAIDSALDGSTVKYSTVYVSGTLSRLGIVNITKDGVVVAELSSATTAFGFSIPLAEGKNTFTITATTTDGTRVSRTITITRSGSDDSSTAENFGQLKDSNDKSVSTDTKPWYEWLFGTFWGYIVVGVVSLLLLLMVSWLFVVLLRRHRNNGGTQL